MDPSQTRRAWEMTEGEKLVAQWEAQHDVAARGSRCDPLGVQHQLSRARVAERAHAHPHGATASRAASVPAPSPAPAPPEPPPADPPADLTADLTAVAGRPPVPPARARRHPWLHRLPGWRRS
ncbi:hypothetical protein SAMN05660464_0728 [Geodermatophilus dictyosporus]|uniref:Uncharacterized protein n=1 Tax=Geodermatophilus dictyosporus TaxID=1523247 RepID=A0A1I5JGE2_9ACTN|nr:hypothetical protein [Geodermatophilus dictyosporus]SFO71877.1 hypothetical protein SAMN05660464_0728 [Geodermatophilus dictyosporus]